MAAAAILDFQKFNFYRLIRLVDPICVSLPDFIKIGQSVVEIWRIFDFSRWRLPPSQILKIAILHVLWRKECHCAAPCQSSSKSVKRLRRYRDFTVFKLVAAAILDFQNFKFLPAGTLERPNLLKPAKFHQDRPIRW